MIEIVVALIVLMILLTPLAVFVLAVIAFARTRRLRGLAGRVERLEHELVMWREAARQRELLAAEPSSVEALPVVPVGRTAALAAEPGPPMPAPEEKLPLPTLVPEIAVLPPPAAPRAPKPAVPWTRRLWEMLFRGEWEASVGGVWLNVLGALVLIIGIALFLGWSLERYGPHGRLVVGFVVSAGLLGSGVLIERRPRYQFFARGLIGGGWAGLYFTTYAMHALEAVRVIENPWIGTLLLAAVAVGMILHSLRYQRQWVTALAYGFSYVTLALSPISIYSTVASVPLVISLLAIAYRYAWGRLAVAGVVTTYGVFAFRFGAAFSSEQAFLGLPASQLMIAVYWLVFETFDIALAARGPGHLSIDRTLFPLNTCGFLGVSLLQGQAYDAVALAELFAVIAGAYLVSALVRARIGPPEPSADVRRSLQRAALGGYEGAITLTAGLAFAAIFFRFQGLTVNLALLLEAEFLFLAGLALRQPYLRILAALVACAPFVRLVALNIHQPELITIESLQVHAWTPLALLMAASLYLNRGLAGRAKEGLLAWEAWYSYAASALIIGVIQFEVPWAYRGVTWLVVAVALFEFGLQLRLLELRYQAYFTGALAVAQLEALGLLGLESEPVVEAIPVWFWLAPAALVLYLELLRLAVRRQAERQGDAELASIRRLALGGASALLATFLWHALPVPLVAVGWAIAGLLLVEGGSFLRSRELRWNGYALTFLAAGRLFFANFTNPGVTAGVSHRLLTVVPLVLLFCYLPVRMRAVGERDRLTPAEARLRRLYTFLPALLLVILLRFELGRVAAVIGWSVLLLVLLGAGIRWQNTELRWQSYLIAFLTFARCWATNFFLPESLSGALGRVQTGAMVIVSLLIAGFLARAVPAAKVGTTGVAGRWLTWVDQHARNTFFVLGSLLLTMLIFQEASGRMLTMSWGIEGSLLVLLGMVVRERMLRWLGLLLLLICSVKVFAYDLAELEAIYRILSFVILGILLLGASWLYARYREVVRHSL